MKSNTRILNETCLFRSILRKEAPPAKRPKATKHILKKDVTTLRLKIVPLNYIPMITFSYTHDDILTKRLFS